MKDFLLAILFMAACLVCGVVFAGETAYLVDVYRTMVNVFAFMRQVKVSYMSL